MCMYSPWYCPRMFRVSRDLEYSDKVCMCSSWYCPAIFQSNLGSWVLGQGGVVCMCLSWHCSGNVRILGEGGTVCTVSLIILTLYQDGQSI